MNNWMYVAIVGAFALGLLIGMPIGRSKERKETAYRKMQMEATELWTNAFKGYLGGRK